MCGDLIWAAEGAALGDGRATHGLLPAAGASARLPRRIGVSRANHLVFTGASISAHRAAAWGFIDEVVPR